MSHRKLSRSLKKSGDLFNEAIWISLLVAFRPCLARCGSMHRDIGKDLIVRIVKSRAGDISPGKNLILIIAAMPVLK